MGHVQLHRVYLAEQTKDILTKWLQPYLPLSIPVLGSLHHTGASDTTLTPGNPQDNALSIWTSFEVFNTSPPPVLFSVIVYSPLNDHQFRFFCTAEGSPAPPSAEEQQHVFHFLQTFIRAFSSPGPLTHGIEFGDALRKVNSASPKSIYIGSLHDKWALCLQSLTVHIVPCYKFIWGPRHTASSPNRNENNGDFYLSEIQDDDIPLIQRRAPWPRSREFLVSRRRFSICARHEGSGDIAGWMLLLPDGSMGMTHVEPAYRRMHLTSLLIHGLNKKLHHMHHSDSEKKDFYPRVRWEHSDVVQTNEGAVSWVKALIGWKQAWVCHWIHLAADEVTHKL